MLIFFRYLCVTSLAKWVPRRGPETSRQPLADTPVEISPWMPTSLRKRNDSGNHFLYLYSEITWVSSGPREVHQAPLITGSLTPHYRIGLALLALIGFRLTHGSPIADHRTD